MDKHSIAGLVSISCFAIAGFIYWAQPRFWKNSEADCVLAIMGLALLGSLSGILSVAHNFTRENLREQFRTTYGRHQIPCPETANNTPKAQIQTKAPQVDHQKTPKTYHIQVVDI